MISASVGVGSSLLLEPARELVFRLPHPASSQYPRCSLLLTNLSPENDIVFRIRTRNPDAFTVRPTNGLLVPGASCQVILTATSSTCERLNAMNPHDLMTRQSSELFLVQSVERKEIMQEMGAFDPNSSKSLRSFWEKLPKNCVTENKLICRFINMTSSMPEVSQSNKLNSRSATSVRMRAPESTLNRNMSRRCSLSARESRGSCNGGSNEVSNRKHRATSNQSTLPDELRTKEYQRRQQSVSSDDSFHTTIEPPVGLLDRRSDARMLTNDGSLQASRTLSSSLNSSSVTDTLLSAQTALSTDMATEESRHEMGPLLYHLQPNDKLSFDVKPGPRYWASTSLFIVNSSQTDCLTFKVRTSNQSDYAVKPSRGIVSVTNAQEVVVSLCAPRHERNFDPLQREANDGFKIEVANLSRDKYEYLMKLDKQKRSQEISSLWSNMPPTRRQSTMLSVEFKMATSDSGNGTTKGFNCSHPNTSSKSNVAANKSRSKGTERQPLKALVQCLNELSTSSTEKLSDSVTRNYQYSDSDESSFTIAPAPVPAVVGGKRNYDHVPDPAASQNSTVIVVSADRMDTVDFSNPKLSFFV